MSQKVDKNISEKITLNSSSVADFKQLLKNNNLSSSDKLLYSYLFVLSLDNADNSSILNVSAKQAMIELNISFVQYYRSRQVLVKQGYIQCYSKALEPLEPPASSSRMEICGLVVGNLINNDQGDEEDQDDEYESDDYDQDDDINSDDENEKENKEQQHQNIKLQTNKNKPSKDITSNLVTPKPNKPNVSKPNLTIAQLREIYSSDDPSYDPDHYIKQRFNDELTMCNPKKSLTPEEIYQSSMLYSVIPSTKIPWNLRLKNFNKLDSDKRNLFLKGMQEQQLQEFNLMAEYNLLIDDEPF